MVQPIRVESWAARGLEDIRGEWLALLVRSSADPLFNSPEWLTTWWAQYGEVLHGELDLRAALNGSRLVGLALMHRRRVIHRPGFEGRCLELLGTARRTKGVGFSEKLGFILDLEMERPAADALARSLMEDSDWDELVLPHVIEEGATDSSVKAAASGHARYTRSPEPMEAWSVRLPGGFEDFLAELGSGTRSRVMGSRHRLQKAGDLRERIIEFDRLAEGWDILDRLHQARWQRPISAHWRAFYGAIAAQQARRGIPVISILEFNDEPISAQLNFRAGGREYSMMSAFVPVEVKRVSPGWAHFGFAIERACADGLTAYDLLGGGGKQEQYKAALGNERSNLVCRQVIRKPVLAGMYRAWDAMHAIRARFRPA